MRDKILDILNDNNFVSGEKLANKLNVSRTSVWKQIKTLKELGYIIESVKNRGYRLIFRPDIPFSEEVTFGLNTKIIGKQYHYFKSLPSTNFFGKKLVKDGTLEGTVIVADVQTRGRGRKDRRWSSPEGGLWFSVVLYPHIPLHQGMLVTMASSVSIVQGIRQVTGLSPMIKWPNDLLLNGKKVCGILTELEAEMDLINYAIVGIGINVNNSIDDELKKSAISIFNIRKSKISRVKLLRSILKYLDFNYRKLISGNFASVKKMWLSYSDIIGRKILVKSEKTVIDGIVKDIDDSGCIILDTVDGITRIFSGDVEYV